MSKKQKTMKRYRRKVIRLQDENDHLRAVLDIIAGDARKMKARLDELQVDEAIKNLDNLPDEFFGDVELSEEDIEFMNAGLGPEQETGNGQD